MFLLSVKLRVCVAISLKNYQKKKKKDYSTRFFSKKKFFEVIVKVKIHPRTQLDANCVDHLSDLLRLIPTAGQIAPSPGRERE